MGGGVGGHGELAPWPFVLRLSDPILWQCSNYSIFWIDNYVSATSVDVLLDGANFTGDLATPFEPTVTIDARLGRPRFVASSAAEKFATLDSRRRAVAHPAGRTQWSGDSIRIAEIRWLFRINQILTTGRFDTGHFRNDRLTVVSFSFSKWKLYFSKTSFSLSSFQKWWWLTWNNLGSSVELLFETSGHIAE